MKNKLYFLVGSLSIITLLFGLTGIKSFDSYSYAAGPPERIDVIIGFAQTPGPGEQALVRGRDGNIKHSFRLVPAIAANIPKAAITGLLRSPRVTSIELDGRVFAIDTEIDNTWGVKRIGSDTVHLSENKGLGVKVAIIDSGIDYTHPDLDANFVGGYDFVNSDTDPMDDNGHGTHVAGTVAAEDNDVGVVGVAPEASLYALKVLNSSGSGSWSDIIAALEWAVDNGIQVTNNSYGSSKNPGGIVQAAFDNSAAAGVLHIAAAGNSGNPKGKGNNVKYPARYDSVLAVAATDQNDIRVIFSSTGDQVELSAPGVSINSTKLGGGYVEFNGTSMASPHVAGTAVLVIAAGITDTNGNGVINDEIRFVLNSTADDLGDSGRDTLYGFGLVNAAVAVAAVGPVTPPDPAVKVNLSADKTDYVSGTDTTAVLTTVVSDENGSAISGLDFSAFVTALNGLAVSVTFTETATTGTYTGNLDISTLADGTYTTEVTVTDSRSLSDTGSTSFTFGPAPAETTTVSVESITYATEGGRNQDKHLLVTFTLADDFGNPVTGAFVSMTLAHDSTSWNGTGTTGSNGTLTFSLKNAPAGCYESTVNNVTAEGLTWDSLTPTNTFCK